jgi:uracil-DNA glycosylase
MPTKTEQLKKIKEEVFELKESPLYEERVKNKVFPVIGEGSHDADIMFVGEAPGKNEAKTGRPFCGAAGKILDELLSSVEIPRTDVYITNIVKDRPPFNRDPLPEEIKVYGPFLDRQIDIIQPKVVATLGRYSMGYIMKKFGLEFELEPISQAHGKAYKASTGYGPIHIIALYHPAAAIYNQHLKDTLKEDFKVLKQHYAKNKKV